MVVQTEDDRQEGGQPPDLAGERMATEHTGLAKVSVEEALRRGLLEVVVGCRRWEGEAWPT